MSPLNTTVHFLAPSLTGKTYLTVGMYAKFRRKPGGFRLYALGADHEPDDDLDLDLTEMWANIKAQVKLDRTTEKTGRNYFFELQHNKSPLIRFDWLDYRGGVLMARKDAPDKAPFQTQISRVEQDGCIFFGLSAEHLSTPIEHDTRLVEEVKEQAEVDRMDHLTKDIPPSTPAVFLITKADLSNFAKRNPATPPGALGRGVVDDVKSLFPDWFAAGSKRLAMICPVSVTSAVNLEAPIIFATWARMHRERQRLLEAANTASTTYSRDADGIANWFYYQFDKDHYNRVNRLERERSEAWKRYTEIIGRLTPLSDMIEPLTAFYDGAELSSEQKKSFYSLTL